MVEPLTLRVPASTSNLGPGFDLLGLALDLALEVTLFVGDGAGEHELVVRGAAAEDWPRNRSNLLLRAYERACEASGLAATACRFEVQTPIPVARGLGSSGASIAAGLLLGAALAPEPPDESELLRLGIELEGHPDNVAASLRGGCTLCLPGNPPTCLDHPLSPELGFAVAWPDLKMPTEAARAALPREVPHADAVENARRLPLLLEGLRRADPELVRRGGVDRLHVPYRLPLIRGARRALAAATEAGAWLATLSGSGSALVAIGSQAKAAEIAEAMAATFREATGSGEGHALGAWTEGPPRLVTSS